jgi:hypothetical protein
MSTEHPVNDESLQDRSEPIMNRTFSTAGGSYEIRIDGSDRILNSPTSSAGKTIHVMLIIGALAVIGVPWMIINMSALPTVGTSHGNGVSSTLNQSFNSTSDRMPEAQKEERLQSHDTIADKVDRDALATLQSMKLSSASGASVGTAPSKHSTGVQRTGLRSGELRSATKLPPVPETRPTTIPGWTLREVTNGTALLEGPNGIWRVMPGQTVPSVGRVDSIVRWGNRFIVATSSGLISTP